MEPGLGERYHSSDGCRLHATDISASIVSERQGNAPRSHASLFWKYQPETDHEISQDVPDEASRARGTSRNVLEESCKNGLEADMMIVTSDFTKRHSCSWTESGCDGMPDRTDFKELRDAWEISQLPCKSTRSVESIGCANGLASFHGCCSGQLAKTEPTLDDSDVHLLHRPPKSPVAAERKTDQELPIECGQFFDVEVLSDVSQDESVATKGGDKPAMLGWEARRVRLIKEPPRPVVALQEHNLLPSPRLDEADTVNFLHEEDEDQVDEAVASNSFWGTPVFEKLSSWF